MWKDYALAIILFALAIFLPRNAQADAIYEDETSTVRLTTLPCPVEVLRHLPEGNRGYFRLAIAKINGERKPTCWAEGEVKSQPGVSQVVIVREDGRWWAIPQTALSPAPGV